MRYLTLTTLLISLSLAYAQSALTCLQYINQLQNIYNASHAQFAQVMAPYLIFSGKILDDMGFPTSCQKYPSNSYWEIELSLTEIEQGSQLTMYYGLCFTSKCNAETLNQQSGFFINNILQNMTQTNYKINSIEFESVDMQVQATPGSIVLFIIIVLFILSRMAQSFIKWGKLCMADSEEQALAIETEELQEEKDAGRMPEYSSTFVQRYSLGRAFNKLFVKQQSNKILGFSLFKLFSLPFIAFGYLFYLSNYGSYNYFSFNSEIYGTFYSKVATFAYYLPDIFYFISAYLFTKKLISLDEIEQDNKQLSIFREFGLKMVKLYPLYLVVMLVYWIISPSLHAGPLWNAYTHEVSQCSSDWWRYLLMIDNWFADGCFNYSWYIQVQFQFALLLSLIFIIYSKNRPAALIVLYVLLVATFILVFAIGGKYPMSVQTVISDNAILYFQAFYSHIFFYLFGVVSAFVFHKESVRSFVRANFSEKGTVFTSFIVVALCLIIFIVLRPAIWENELVLELAFCRIGMMIAFLIFFLPSLADQEMINVSYIHKLSKLTYSIILWLGLIVSCGFWGLDSFAYVDGINLLQSSLTYLLISIGVGGALGVVFDFTPFTFAK